jgi:O-antigen ligase
VIALGVSIPASVALDNILLALMLVAWLAAGGFREQLVLAFQNRIAATAFALFCALAAGVTYGSANPGDGLTILGKYLDLAFVPIFVCQFRDERVRRQALLAFALMLALTLILSCLLWAGVIPTNSLMIGDSANPGIFKRYLTQSVMMAFGALLFAQLGRTAQLPWQRYGWWALAILAVINVAIMTQGRTGQLILAALVLYFAHAVWRWRGTLGTTAVIMVVIGAIAMGAVGKGNRYARAIDEWNDWRPGQPVHVAAEAGIRLEFYRNSLEIISDHPFIGTGTGSFAKVYADRVAGTAMVATVNPHNEYLNIAVQLGLAGLLLMLYLFYKQWRLASALPTVYERQLAHGLVITFVIGCLFNSLLFDHAEGLLFAWASGLLFAGLTPHSGTVERAT